MKFFKRLFKNKKVAIPVVSVVAVVLIGAGIVFSQKGFFNIFADTASARTVTARIVDSSGNPIAGVRLRDNVLGDWDVATDENGLAKETFRYSYASVTLEANYNGHRAEQTKPVRSNTDFTITLANTISGTSSVSSSSAKTNYTVTVVTKVSAGSTDVVPGALITVDSQAKGMTGADGKLPVTLTGGTHNFMAAFSPSCQPSVDRNITGNTTINFYSSTCSGDATPTATATATATHTTTRTATRTATATTTATSTATVEAYSNKYDLDLVITDTSGKPISNVRADYKIDNIAAGRYGFSDASGVINQLKVLTLNPNLDTTYQIELSGSGEYSYSAGNFSYKKSDMIPREGGGLKYVKTVLLRSTAIPVCGTISVSAGKVSAQAEGTTEKSCKAAPAGNADVYGTVKFNGKLMNATVNIEKTGSSSGEEKWSVITNTGDLVGNYSSKVVAGVDYTIWATSVDSIDANITYESDRKTFKAAAPDEEVEVNLELMKSTVSSITDIRLFGMVFDSANTKALSGVNLNLKKAKDRTEVVKSANSTNLLSNVILGNYNYVLNSDDKASKPEINKGYILVAKKSNCTDASYTEKLAGEGKKVESGGGGLEAGVYYNFPSSGKIEMVCIPSAEEAKQTSRYSISGDIKGFAAGDVSDSNPISVHLVEIGSGGKMVKDSQPPSSISTSDASYTFAGLKKDYLYHIFVEHSLYDQDLPSTGSFRATGDNGDMRRDIVMVRKTSSPAESPDDRFTVKGKLGAMVGGVLQGTVKGEIKFTKVSDKGEIIEIKGKSTKPPSPEFTVSGLSGGKYQVTWGGGNFAPVLPEGSAGKKIEIEVSRAKCPDLVCSLSKDFVLIHQGGSGLSGTLGKVGKIIGNPKGAIGDLVKKVAGENIDKVQDAVAQNEIMVPESILLNKSSQNTAYAAGPLPLYKTPRLIFTTSGISTDFFNADYKYGDVKAGLGLIAESHDKDYGGLQIVAPLSTLDGTGNKLSKYFGGLVGALYKYYPDQIGTKWAPPADKEIRLNLEAERQSVLNRRCDGFDGIGSFGTFNEFWAYLATNYAFDGEQFSRRMHSTAGADKGSIPACKSAKVAIYETIKEEMQSRGIGSFKGGAIPGTTNGKSSDLAKSLASLGFTEITPATPTNLKTPFRDKAYTLNEIESKGYLN